MGCSEVYSSIERRDPGVVDRKGLPEAYYSQMSTVDNKGTYTTLDSVATLTPVSVEANIGLFTDSDRFVVLGSVLRDTYLHLVVVCFENVVRLKVLFSTDYRFLAVEDLNREPLNVFTINGVKVRNPKKTVDQGFNHGIDPTEEKDYEHLDMTTVANKVFQVHLEILSARLSSGNTDELSVNLRRVNAKVLAQDVTYPV